MIKMIKSKKPFKCLSLLICVTMLIVIMPTTILGAKTGSSTSTDGTIGSDNTTNTKSDRIIVSMGDSYSSGEGVEDFYDQDSPLAKKIKSEDWLAHRSQESWGGQLKLPGLDKQMKEYKTGDDVHWYFVAASGATTADIDGSQSVTYYKNKGDYTNTVSLPAQNDIFDTLASKNKKADYVTITIGGNDVGFSDIVKQAATGSGYLLPNGFSDLSNTLVNIMTSDDIVDTLMQTYKSIYSKSGAKIIVAGYPTLVEQSGKGIYFNKYEAELINATVKIFNMKIHRAVMLCELDENSGGIYHFVSVEDDFAGYEAYSDEPYINEISAFKKDEDIDDRGMGSAYSLHPNKKGIEVYRDCVQTKIDELERVTSDERDIVLVLDVSDSMSGTPLTETKKAATKFVSTVLQEDASIGIVTYNSSAERVSDFSITEQALTSVIDDISSGDATNIEAGLQEAVDMLETSHAEKKIIVLMSDGQPNRGKVDDELVAFADSIKNDDTYIYTLGFFEELGSEKNEAQTLMEEIASDGCHYEVADADDLVYFFGDIADQINGQKYIYVRIACPVDVKVTYDGEILSSLEDSSRIRTSYGSLTFEENKSSSSSSSDNRIKVMRLKDGADYDIEISGNGNGKMNYTIGFMDESGEYSDLREFKDIQISSKTQIDTVASNSPTTMLNVDSDGDGKYDLKYKAEANSEAVLVDYTYIYYIILAAVILIVLLILYIMFRRWQKKAAQRKQQKLAMQKKFCTRCGNQMPGNKSFCSKCGNKL